MKESHDSAELLAVSGNYAVVQLPRRQYPAISIQGDSLKILQSTAEELAEYIQTENLSEAEFTLREITSTITSMLTFYEATLAERGLRPPYA